MKVDDLSLVGGSLDGTDKMAGQKAELIGC